MAKAVSPPTTTAVSIHPSSFTEPSVMELPADEVVRMYHGQETKRKRNAENYGESDVAVSFRFVPEGLMAALDDISSSTGVRKSVLTKCLSHHVMTWYQGLPLIVNLSRIYRDVQMRSDGFPDVIRKVHRDDYDFIHPRSCAGSVGVLRTVAYVLGFLGDISVVLGIPVYKLFLSGLCWSLSTNSEGWAGNTVSKYLQPERDNLLTYLGERLLALDYADKLVRLRQGDEVTVAYVHSLELREWH